MGRGSPFRGKINVHGRRRSGDHYLLQRRKGEPGQTVRRVTSRLSERWLGSFFVGMKGKGKRGDEEWEKMRGR